MGLFSFWKNRKRAGLDFEEIEQNISSGATVVDVRTVEEYIAEHARGAVNIPVQEMYIGNFGALSKNQKIYLYCRSGNRSAQAERLLRDAGYADIVDLRTLSNWKNLGGET